jgi:hypothetical protein
MEVDGMEAIAMFAGLVIILAVFAIASMGWGVDSRDPMPDDHRR